MGVQRRQGRGTRGQKLDIESAVQQLVEAEQYRLAAEAELERIKAASEQPEPPEEFAQVDELVEHHRRVLQYEDKVKRLKQAIVTAETSYNQAAELLRDVLPEDVPLTYDYPGRREDMVGKRYVVIKREGKVVVPAIEESPRARKPGRRS
jgi:hypothetical protein